MNNINLKSLNSFIMAMSDGNYNSQYNAQTTYEVSKHIEANYIAEILIHAKLNVPQLNRKYLQKLHSGKLEWVKKNGEKVSLKANFNFKLLEKLGLIFFEYNWIHFASSLPDSKNLHESVKDIVQFVKKLSQLFDDKYCSSQYLFKAHKQKIESFLPKDYTFNSQGINLKNDRENYIISIQLHEINNQELVLQYYWKKLIQYDLADYAWKHFFDFYRILDRFWTPDISIFTNKEQDMFLDFCSQNINKSSTMHLDITEYQRIHLMSQYPDTLFYKSYNNLKKNKISPLSIDEILSPTNIDIPSTQSDIELITWYRHPSTVDNHLYGALLQSSFSYLINNSMHLDFITLNSNPRIQKLISESKRNPIKRLFLIIKGETSKDIKYELYLMSRADTCIAGCLNLISKIKSIPPYHQGLFSLLQKNISTEIARKLIEVTLFQQSADGESWEKDLAEFLLYLAKHSNYRDENNNIESQIFKEVLAQIDSYQFQKIVPLLLIELKTIRMDNSRNLEDNLYCLFELFQMTKVFDNKSISTSIQSSIFEYYQTCFQYALKIDSVFLRANRVYDLFPWHLLDNEYLNKFINLAPKTKNIVSSLSNDNNLYVHNALHNYLQVLINICINRIHSNSKITPLLTNWIKTYAFNYEDYSWPLFDERTLSNDYSVWNRVTNILNEFKDEQFVDIFEELKSNISLSAITTLYQNTLQQQRKNLLLVFIKSKKWNLKNYSLGLIEKIFVNAINGNLLQLAEIALAAAEDFIKNSSHNKRKMFQERIYLWDVYKYKYELIKIFYSEKDIDFKLESIQGISPPIIAENNTYPKELLTETQRFKQHITGLLYLNNNTPEVSEHIFQSLMYEAPSPVFKQLYFHSKIQYLLKENADRSSYLSVLKEYKNSYKEFSIHMLQTNDKADYLNWLYLAKEFKEVISLCSKLIDSELFNKKISTYYIKSMNELNMGSKAKQHLEAYVNFHKTELTDDNDLKAIKEEIASAIKKELDTISTTKTIPAISTRKTNDELRAAYNEICQREIKDMAYIIKDINRVESFLYNEVVHACKELLMRNKNLDILGANINEDITNDWLTSLLTHKFSWFPITVHDQKRTGKSGKGIDVGETDGLILHRGLAIAMLEAFKLSSITKKTINDHLNKISDYTPNALSPIFIIIYSYSNNFRGLGNRYIKYIKTIQYSGFENIKTNEHQLKIKDEIGDNLTIASEVRFRGNKPITIFHILINLNCSPK